MKTSKIILITVAVLALTGCAAKSQSTTFSVGHETEITPGTTSPATVAHTPAASVSHTFTWY